MFLRRPTKSIAISATVIAVLAVVASPAAISVQGAPGSGGPRGRSGPAAGGVVGKVDSVSTSSFAVLTSAGQKVTIQEALRNSGRRQTRSQRVPLQKATACLYSGWSTDRPSWPAMSSCNLSTEAAPRLPRRQVSSPSSAVYHLRQSRSVRSQPITIKGRGRS